jgi:rhamnose utilization protein RhaD (predicted bifunctional aldolase and dehydrogenase)
MEEGREFPGIIFLQNHGVFVSGSTAEEIDRIYRDIFAKISDRLPPGCKPVGRVSPLDRSLVEEARQILRALQGEGVRVLGFVNQDILDFGDSEEAFRPLSLSFTPDHIVYYGFKPVYAESFRALTGAFRAYREENGVEPRLAVIKGVGAFSFNTSPSMAEKGRDLFIDDVNIAVYVKGFGGHQFMPAENIDFIRNWEVEKYRASLSK